MKITFSDKKLAKGDTLVIILSDTLKFGSLAASLDAKTLDVLKKAMKTREFKGKKYEMLTILAPVGAAYEQIILLGLGKVKSLNQMTGLTAGGRLYATLSAAKSKSAVVLAEAAGNNADTLAADIAYGLTLRSYRFDKYFTDSKKNKKPVLKTVDIIAAARAKAAKLFETHKAVAAGVFLTRNVVTEPPNVLYPESYANIIAKEFEGSDVKVTVLARKQLEKLGMGALLGVGQGSIRDSHVVILEYRGDKSSKEAPLAFVGKGVTFDTGGISIKPAAGMEDMKYDMGGSAVVVGLLKALSGRKAKANVVGAIGLVENMPGHNAQRPSDVVTTMSGQTVEVLNTDAEGRLVLADVLTYVQEKHEPKLIVDLATLTGAIVIALGEEYAGLFSNNDKLSEKLAKSGEETHEKLWRFPLGEAYDKMIDSKIADMQNISAGRGAGSITAAQFLQRFIKGKTPWAHLDIAGVAWTKKAKDVCPEGATAFGVRLLDHFVSTNYEK